MAISKENHESSPSKTARIHHEIFLTSDSIGILTQRALAENKSVRDMLSEAVISFVNEFESSSQDKKSELANAIAEKVEPASIKLTNQTLGSTSQPVERKSLLLTPSLFNSVKQIAQDLGVNQNNLIQGILLKRLEVASGDSA